LKNLQIALVLLVFGTGIMIRLFDLTDPPMDFHPARQYHSAVIARGIYTRWGGEYPEEQAALNRAQETSEARIEPPIFEYLVAATFTLARTDALWIARLYAILFWVAGGVPLYLLAKRLQGYPAGLVALGVYLLLPYGVLASRSFQPDPLMVSLSIFTLWALDHWQQSSSWRHALPAGIFMGLAILVKQVEVFFLLAAFLGMVWVKWGLKDALRRPQVWAIGVLAALPALVYNIYGVFISGALAGQYTQRFFPSLWIDPGFYIRWSNMVQTTVGLPLFLIAILGLLVYQNRTVRGMLLGFMMGYLLYGFIFAHHISTHDYYQLPVLPLVALGLGAAASRLFLEIRKVSGPAFGSIAITVVLLAGVLLSLWEARSVLKAADYRQDPALLVQLMEEMGGAKVATIGLMKDYGAALYYYSYNLPMYWWPDENGIPLNSMNTEQLESTIQKRTAGKEFFIVTDFKALNSQPSVQSYLDSNYELFFDNERYRIYDLRDPD
jgi:hypothetical protein